jgi:hypothetical protein
MEKQQITFAFGRTAFENLREAFEDGRWLSWEFPDYVFKFELDPSIQDGGVVQRHDGRRLETQRLMAYAFPHSYLPDDITKILNRSYAEAVRCYEVGCFLACIALCGRTIETAIGSLYERRTGIHPSAEPTKPGLNAILNRLKRDGYNFPPALKEKMEVIALHRNSAIHGNLLLPTDDEARSVIYSTRDVLMAIAI